MKRGFLILIVLLAAILLVYIGFSLLKKNVQLAPSQPTDIRIQVGNIAPVITAISAIPAVNLNPAPSTTSVTFTFTASDRNGAADLNNAAASANFNRIGEATRTAACSFQSQQGRTRTYQCIAALSHYDRAGTWNVAVSVQDQSALSASSTSTFTVNLLKDISIIPTLISFPTVAQEDFNITSTIPTNVTNNGNFQAPADGSIRITAFNLQGETNPGEVIPASNFKASGSSGSSTVCDTGNSLADSSAVSIASANLPRGISGSNRENITYCLTLVPAGISTQFYSATGGRAWIIEI